MDRDDPTLEELIAEYRETCQREGDLASELRSVRMDKARQIARLNHVIGKIGQHDRDVRKFGEEHVDDPRYERAMREAEQNL